MSLATIRLSHTGASGFARINAWRVAALALTALILAALAPALVNPPPTMGVVVGWDLAVFVTGAHMVVDGQADRLYDPAAVYAERQRVIGVEPGLPFPPGLPFNSPPTQVLPFLPFVWLPFPVIEAVHRALMLVAFAAAMYLLRAWLPVPWYLAAAIGLASGWSLLNVSPGQETALLALVWAAAARLVLARRLNLAALVLALGAIRPQLVDVGLLALLLGSGWRGVLACAASQYLAGLAIMRDPAWPLTWLHGALAGQSLVMGDTPTLPAWGVAVALALVLVWLLVPRQHRALAFILLLPCAQLAALPYAYGYYYQLALPTSGVAAWLAVRASRNVPAGSSGWRKPMPWTMAR